MDASTATITYPLATTTWDAREYDALQRIIASGRFTMGAEVRAFEEEFAAFFGARYAVMVNSGSSANLLAVQAAVLSPDTTLRPGDEVIVPAVSWSTTYYPVTQAGLRLRFVDIDRETLNLDLDKAEEAIGPNTKAILAVNLLGNPMNFARLTTMCSDHDLVMLEDNCESLGAKFDDRFTGTFGLAGTFSSFFSHHISTMEGGLVTTDDRYVYEAMVSMRAHGWTRELPDNNLIHPKTGDAFDDLFRFVLPGYNVRPLEMSGALGRQQLAKVPDLVNGRRLNAALFQERFAGHPDILIQKETGESSWFGFSIILTNGLAGKRRRVVDALRDAGIECRPIVAGNFTRNPVIARLDAYVPEELPGADEVHDNGIFVGNHHYALHREIELLADTLDALAR
jgi:CDP-6-deoxy-D-xylo-4-hexulose-3-dehydrase